jgi:hypothetical protein
MSGSAFVLILMLLASVPFLAEPAKTRPYNWEVDGL